jgi:hypothetical protein
MYGYEGEVVEMLMMDYEGFYEERCFLTVLGRSGVFTREHICMND